MPNWYEGGFPDRELVVMDLLKPFLDLVDVLDADGDPVLDGATPRRPYVCTVLPNDYSDRLPVVRVFRAGGAADADIKVDPAMVQVAVVADSREDSWKLLEYCRQMLLSFHDGGTVTRTDGSKTLIDTVSEMVGPAQFAELNPEKRFTQLNFRVTCRKPRGGPDYQKIRESLT